MPRILVVDDDLVQLDLYAQILPKQGQDALHARLAGSGEPVGPRTADHGRSGPERNGLDDVGTAPEPAVHQPLHLCSDGVDDLDEGPERARQGVELSTAVVRDDDRVGAAIDRTPGIVRSEEHTSEL